jgi:hypothetical protein
VCKHHIVIFDVLVEASAKDRSGQGARKPVTRLLIGLAVGVMVITAGPIVAGADVIPYLLPGRSVVMTGSHVSCAITKTSVSCTKAGGLTATVATTGAVRVTKGARTLFATAKPLRLHVNGGFANLGSNDSNVYCHVYLAGVPTLTCSVNGGSVGATYKPNSHCFDISDRSVVVCRYDAAGDNRHDIKTFPQP